MKPHEGTLVVVPSGSDEYCLAEDGGHRMVAVFRRQEAEDWQRLLSAAPDMARALLALLAAKQGVIMTRAEAELFSAAQLALAKAGVLP